MGAPLTAPATTPKKFVPKFIPKFIKEEGTQRTTSLISLNRRLFESLPLFLKVFPLTVITILLASAGPSLFRWYAGKYVSSSDTTFTLHTLSLIVGLAALFRILAWVLFEACGMWSSQGIYAQMISGLSKTRTTFFDENPSGRIINRLVRDYDELRSTAIIFVGDLINATVELLCIAGLACIASPWSALMIFPLLGIFTFIQIQRSVMVEHCRALSAVASSEVLNRKNDLIEGREVFVLYEKSEHLLARMTASLRTYLQAYGLTNLVDIWASFWIRFFSEVFSLIVLISTILALNSGRIDVPIAGVIISALFGITGSIGWLDFASSLVSRSAPHIRRVFEFVDLPSETQEEREEEIKEDLRISSAESFIHPSGPTVLTAPYGDLVFDNYSMSYRPGLPLILKDLNLTVAAGKKTALIGRTGAGKSSVIQSLLRMVYVHSGDIRMGEKSILKADIYQLRRLFGVVPQTPYLFEGPLKMNLDRTGSLNEIELQSALSSVGLDYALSVAVKEGGLNFSVGERQLICLARVIACNRPFILMDEPTSGLDPETDARMTYLLNNALKNKTVITIAHRPESLKHYDSVIEMKPFTTQ